MVDGHEEDEASLGEDVEDGEQKPQEQQLRHFASEAGEDENHNDCDDGGNDGDALDGGSPQRSSLAGK